MNTGTILQISPGKVVPKEHIEAIREKFPTVVGFALQHENELVPEAYDDASLTTDDIIELQEHAKDGWRVFYFGNWPKFADISDVMPYIMSTKEDSPIMAFFLDGNFSALSGVDGKHIDEYNTVTNILFPRIAKAYDDAGEDFDKFIETMKSEATKKIFTSTFKDRGWFTFLPYKGVPWGFGNNDKARGFEWGTLSNADGVNIPEPKAAPATTESKGSALSFLRNKKSGTTAVEQPPVSTETDTKIPWTMVEVPKQLEKSARNAWVRIFYGEKAIGLNPDGEGDLPANHQSKEFSIPVHPSLVPFTKEKVQNSKDVKALSDRVKGLARKSETPIDMKSAHEEIEKKSKSTVREPYQPSVGEYPVMGDDDKSKAMEKMIKFLDAGSKKRLTPIELQKMEAKWVPFSTDIGVKFEDMLFRSVNEIEELFDGNKIATSAYIEMRRAFVEKSGIKLEELVASKEAVESKAPVAEEPAKKVGNALSFLKNKKQVA